MLPNVALDTSSVNWLADDAVRSEASFAALQCGFHVRLPAIAVDEILSVPVKNSERREALLTGCQRLLRSGECIWAPDWILGRQVQEYVRNPSLYDWTKLVVRAAICERWIIDRNFTDQLCIEQRKFQLEQAHHFDKLWTKLRPKFDEVLAQDPAKRPTTYQAAASIATIEGGVLWGFGQELYRYVAGRTPTEAEIRTFMDVCPPFRAGCYALVMAWYVGGLRPLSHESSAGRNDLMMAAYLPYCDRFLTNDWAQEKSLREIATEARIDCDIQSCENFNASFMIEAQGIEESAR